MKRAIFLSLPLIALAQPNQVHARSVSLPDRLELGRNSLGNPCTATRNWSDAGLTDAFAVGYSYTCRGSTGNRLIGLARVIPENDLAPLDATFICGEARAASVPGIGDVRSRRCLDKLLGQPTIETRVIRKGKIYSVSTLAFAQGPAEELLKALLVTSSLDQDPSRTTSATVRVEDLPAAPGISETNVQAAASAEDALRDGLRLIQQGLHLDASRVANDALSRLPADYAPSTRIELLLLAGLADSNISFFDSADDFFAKARALLLDNPSLPGADILASKERNYIALHELNKLNFAAAATSLNGGEKLGLDQSQPLLDAPTLQALNQIDGRGGTSDLVAAANESMLQRLVIDAQSAWVRSVALLGQNRPEEAAAALGDADRAYAALAQERINRQRLLWLSARIERQRARIALRQGDRTKGLAALDKAIADLRLAANDGDRGPVLAETQLERAAVLSGGNADREVVFSQFDDAISSLLSAQSDMASLPPKARDYLVALIAAADERKDLVMHERYFRALQAAVNPAVARQFVKLQSVVSADPALAAKVQDRQDLETEINRLRYQIASTSTQDTEQIAKLEKTRADLENRSLVLQSELSADRSYVQVDDAPAAIAEIQSVLQPNEGYFKLAKVGGYVFGIVIDQSGAQIFRVTRPAVEIEPVVAAVRKSITGGEDTVPVFSVSGANALYQLLTGPASKRIASYASLVVDASGVLDSLPFGVLVTEESSSTAFARSRRADPYDYRAIQFLARKTDVSTALSPRSLLVSRKLPESRAPLPFIGFAQHQPVTLTAEVGGQMISIGQGCETEKSTIAALGRTLEPINARELTEVKAALGVGSAEEVTGAAFTDTAITRRTDLDQFQVLHFATHGLTEGQWGCGKAPPALVTSLDDSGADGILSIDEVARLRLDANLVVLSACDTASGLSKQAARTTGQETVGASLDGLVRAFLAARAHAVLSTYWPVSDAGETEALVTDFYRNARTLPIGRALQKAQASLMAGRDSSHPLFWGAFVLVGDGQKALLTGAARLAIDKLGAAPVELH